MSNVKREWLDNAFWHDENKDKAEAILVITDDKGRQIDQVLTVRKLDPLGNINPDFEELLESVSEEKIDANTKERAETKARDAELEDQQRKSEERARELEKLFDAKIKTLEVSQIKNTKNKTLKSKLRRSKNVVEMQTYAVLIMMEELGVKFEIEEKSE